MGGFLDKGLSLSMRPIGAQGKEQENGQGLQGTDSV